MRAPSIAKCSAMERPRPVPPPLRKIARPLSISCWNTRHRPGVRIDGSKCSGILVYRRNDRTKFWKNRRLSNEWMQDNYERLALEDGGNGTAHGFRILGSEEIVGRKFLAQLAQ